eukprot:CAMPEP_0177405524 /NCGR_PEP_ID=MMETSP0368-20130122/62031_1 /TAXON_ID=447022 ORGANISM="Scrippsiella hangoei-like, Strain SHHI-4" /NCGR_SAMPLE_ID=MMETSP0368 /ASSEMBLY_ACC=CAM_ASM_000363 /LENGTH=54 /DNA_ID=CAMNT_0018873781 /DNA_START=9 /DNA_END=169 /DNA_ORIENTATION=-
MFISSTQNTSLTGASCWPITCSCCVANTFILTLLSQPPLTKRCPSFEKPQQSAG